MQSEYVNLCHRSLMQRLRDKECVVKVLKFKLCFVIALIFFAKDAGIINKTTICNYNQ